MPEVGAALAAGDLHPLHAVAVVLGVGHGSLDGTVERGPAAAGVKLRIRVEQHALAADAEVVAALAIVEQGAAVGALGALLPADMKLLGAQLAAPLFRVVTAHTDSLPSISEPSIAAP